MYRNIARSAQFRILVICAALVFLPLTAGTFLVSGLLAEGSVRDSVSYLRAGLKAASLRLDDMLDSLESLYVPFISDETFLDAVRNLRPLEERKTYAEYREQTTIDSRLGEIHRTNAGNRSVDSIYAYSISGRTLFATSYEVGLRQDITRANSVWLARAEYATGKRRWLVSTSEDGKEIVSGYYWLKDFRTREAYGLLSVNILGDAILDLARQLDYGLPAEPILVDPVGNALSPAPPAPETLEAIRTGIGPGDGSGSLSMGSGRKRLLVYARSEETGWTIALSVPEAALDSTASLMRLYGLLVYAAILILVVLSMVLSVRYLYVPVRQLVEAMGRFGKGDFTVRLPESRISEIDILNRGFNGIVGEIRTLIDDRYRTDLILKTAKLETIRSQINEHFLYNTLDTIHWYAEESGDSRISGMIMNLSRFFRLSLGEGEDEIAVGTLLEICRNYLWIQKMRLEEKLEYSISVDEEVRNMILLKYLLQPIVENAVIHGVMEKRGPGRIEICARRLGEELSISVRDDGAGMQPSPLEALRRKIGDVNDATGGFSALRTVNLLLGLRYGTGHSLSIESVEGLGTMVSFRVPLSLPGGRGTDASPRAEAEDSAAATDLPAKAGRP